jgi:hypothetical protein
VKRGAKSGWQLRSNHLIPPTTFPPAAPSGFDRLLARLNICESEVAINQQARQWITKHYRHSYVPEKILDSLGLVVDEGVGPICR